MYWFLLKQDEKTSGCKLSVHETLQREALSWCPEAISAAANAAPAVTGDTAEGDGGSTDTALEAERARASGFRAPPAPLLPPVEPPPNPRTSSAKRVQFGSDAGDSKAQGTGADYFDAQRQRNETAEAVADAADASTAESGGVEPLFSMEGSIVRTRRKSTAEGLTWGVEAAAQTLEHIAQIHKQVHEVKETMAGLHRRAAEGQGKAEGQVRTLQIELERQRKASQGSVVQALAVLHGGGSAARRVATTQAHARAQLAARLSQIPGTSPLSAGGAGGPAPASRTPSQAAILLHKRDLQRKRMGILATP